jgi:hypothetical protein
MWWDEHGGTYVIKVGGLEVQEAGTDHQGEAGLRLEVDFSESGGLLDAIAEFASQQRLALTPPEALPTELAETPLLAAFHVPGNNLFIYCEEPVLKVRRLGPRALGLAVTGEFRVRKVPCGEADIVIHLNGAAMGRVLAYGAAMLKDAA